MTSAGPTLRGDGPVETEAAVELVAARDAADAAEAADKAARGAAAEAAKSAREAAKQAGRAETAAKSLRGRRGWRSRVRSLIPAHAIAGESVEPEIVTFSDLVRAHRAWEPLYGRAAAQERDSGQRDNKEIEREFRRRWRQFEGRYGRIVDAYWSVRDASAVALTVDRKPKRFHPEGEFVPRFHRATDWATRDEPAIAEALDECETLAVKSEEILRGASELIALRRLYAMASHLLGFVDREWLVPAEKRPQHDEAHEKESSAFVSRQRTELGRIERFYHRAGNRQARIVFFLGMASGLVALLALLSLTVPLIWTVDRVDGGAGHWPQLELFIISVMAGALGAILSVLSRMASLTGKFELDHEVGRKNVRWLGIYRPFMGAIFGISSFLLLASGILQTDTPGSGKDYAYYGTLALLSGFFERFTKIAPGGVPTPLEEAEGKKKDEGESDKTPD